MQSLRPLLDAWRTSPWLATTMIDATETSPGTSVPDLVDQQVQIGLRGSGPVSTRELVALTPAARELLHGTHREAAHRVFRGMLATMDGQRGANDLRGISLSTDDGAFAVQMLLSSTEAGLAPDAVRADDEQLFERALSEIVPQLAHTRAQNLGWLDYGPVLSGKIRSLIEAPPRVANDDAKDVAVTTIHELAHNDTPFDVHTTPPKYHWLEEGLAEVLAWWPGRAAALLDAMGTPLAAGDTVDQWSAPKENVASSAYRERHRFVLGVLGLAGVHSLDEDGSPVPGAYERAHQLLQGDDLSRVPRNLARAVVREQGLDASLVDPVAELILESEGRAGALRDLTALLRDSPDRTRG